ncbi:MAG TPA: ABC transporter substrate-binding protein [Casimicrobiaceae bacterium]|nr:ABC transporter substrate-binding protein [Casimicrobiaceae bacterium]
MTRRTLLVALGTTLVTWPFGGRGQPSAGVPHIGYISLGSPRSNGAFLDAFKDGLRELGYADGRNIVIDVRWAGDSPDELPRLAASLVKDRPNAIIGTCIPSTRAAKEATRTIPVVMSVDGDPVAAGLIASLARPGGNVTGTSTLFEELIPKWVELLTTAAPRMRKVALLHNPNDLVDPFYAGQVEQAAKRVGVEVSQFEADVAEDLDRAFAAMKASGASGLVVLTEAAFAAEVERIVSLENRYKLPAIYGFREFARAGGLMSYGVSYRDYYKGLARYVDAVLKGTKPADLPVEQPRRIELVVNLKTAKALDLVIPQALLLRADEVIQ